MVELEKLEQIAKSEFADIVSGTLIIDAKLRIILMDGSYIDFWWSEVQHGRFAYHWNRLHLDGTIYRHDNSPHKRWKNIKTFPKHFHSGKESSVVKSHIPTDPTEAVREFLKFSRNHIKKIS